MSVGRRFIMITWKKKNMSFQSNFSFSDSNISSFLLLIEYYYFFFQETIFGRKKSKRKIPRRKIFEGTLP